MKQVTFTKLDKNARLPVYKTDHAAGMDVYPLGDYIMINPGEVAKIKTGISVRIPAGCYGRLAPRSSLSQKGIVVEGGVIDRDYDGEIMVLMRNTTDKQYSVELKKDRDYRICQLIVEKIYRPVVREAAVLPPIESNRTGGFGSTNRVEEESSDDDEQE